MKSNLNIFLIEKTRNKKRGIKAHIILSNEKIVSKFYSTFFFVSNFLLKKILIIYFLSFIYIYMKIKTHGQIPRGLIENSLE